MVYKTQPGLFSPTKRIPFNLRLILPVWQSVIYFLILWSSKFVTRVLCVRLVQRAQLAAAALTKNEARERRVKFIDPPFMTFGLSILMRKGDVTSNIGNMIDLGSQDRIRYGMVGDGSTASFFGDPGRGDDLYRMWNTMNSHQNVSFLESVEAGVRRVRESTDSDPFAFIGEKYAGVPRRP